MGGPSALQGPSQSLSCGRAVIHTEVDSVVAERLLPGRSALPAGSTESDQQSSYSGEKHQPAQDRDADPHEDLVGRGTSQMVEQDRNRLGSRLRDLVQVPYGVRLDTDGSQVSHDGLLRDAQDPRLLGSPGFLTLDLPPIRRFSSALSSVADMGPRRSYVTPRP